MIGDIPMRRFESQIHDRKIITAILDQIQIVTVGINDGDYPYVVPLSFGYEATEEKLLVYVHCAREGHKVDLWKKNPKVSLTFCTLTNHPNDLYRGVMHDYRSVMANGIIRHIDRTQSKSGHGTAVQALLRHNGRRPNQFSVPHYMFMDMYVVECEWKHVTAKSEGPIEDISEVPFPTLEEIRKSTAPGFNHSKFFSIKHYLPVSTEGKGMDRELLEAESLHQEIRLLNAGESGKILFRFSWQADGEPAVDGDILTLLLNEEGKLMRRYDSAFYNQKKDRSQAVEFLGDDILNEYGREAVRVDVGKVPEYCHEIAFHMALYRAGELAQNLGMVNHAAAEIVREEDGAVLGRYALPIADPNAQAAVLMRICRAEDGSWMLLPSDGRSFEDWHATEIFAAYGLKRWKE